jgi:type III restriction enzyme
MATTRRKINASNATYMDKHGRTLTKVINDYTANQSTYNLFATNDYAIFSTIRSGITKHSLRSYQMEALYVMDYLLKLSDGRDEKKALLETVDVATHLKAPFLGYEMATGSGKTMLMGASTFFLNQKFGIRNFLIITPASTDIYQKTIRNFQIGGLESVWADDTPFKFNLITGDNFTQNLIYDENADANIFIFNIAKFGTNASRTEKPWEDAAWLKQGNNSISIKQFLKGQKLVIITDEAHHAQTPAAKKIIHDFEPTAVLEFTATAVENERGLDRRNQQVVYRYDIRRFLEDGHGKLVRAVALAGSNLRTKENITASEKLKLVTLFLIHLLKKQAVLKDPKCRALKPIAFVKVKEETSYTEHVYRYIKNDLANDLENINIILGKIKAQDLGVTKVLTQLYKEAYDNKLNKLRHDIQASASTAIFYHGKSDKETEKKFANIRKNDVEVVVYMQRLDEGIDLPNIYSMAVINDSESNFKTSVKQIIGRGVRLNKDKREFDDSDDPMLQQAEMLHIVCDQGKNFEEVIAAIQQEFGLNNKYLSFEKKRIHVTNHAKSDLLKGKYLPHIKADYKAKDSVSLIDLVEDVDTIITRYIDDNTFAAQDNTNHRFLKYRPDSFFLEVDIFASEQEYHKQLQQSGGVPTQLTLTSKEAKSIYAQVQVTLYCLPDSKSIQATFQRYIDKLNQRGLHFYRLSEGDEKLAINLLVSSFSFFYRNHIEKNYYNVAFRQVSSDDSWSLSNRFKDYSMLIPEDQQRENLRGKVKGKDDLIHLIDSGYQFKGFEKSIYDYTKFDSYLEYQMANYLNEAIVPYKSDNKSFWIKNNREVYFTYGSRKYYPDFICFHNDMIYVIETKGEIFSDTKKNALLLHLSSIKGELPIKGYKGVLVFSEQMSILEAAKLPLEEFVSHAEKLLETRHDIGEMVSDPPVAERFKTYLPVFTPEKAYKKYLLNHRSPKPDGWLKVAVRPEAYPQSLFMCQIKGDALSKSYANSKWIIMDSDFDSGKINGKIVIVFANKIRDQYTPGYSIRRLEVIEQAARNRLFGDKIIKLSSDGSASESYELNTSLPNEKVEIVAVEFDENFE